MVNFTLDELANFSREEKKLINEMMGTSDNKPLFSPSLKTIQRVLNYAKSTSMRKNQRIGTQTFFLN